MSVIVMGREMGSQGNLVASGVSDRLGVPLVHYELIDHLSDRSRVRRSHVVRLLDERDDPSSSLTPDHTLPAILSAYEILELANLPEGALLRGWGATALLADVSHVVRVRVTAPLEARLETLQKKFPNASMQTLQQEIELFDEAHAAIMKRHFDIDFRDDSGYHLVLDTSKTSPDKCIEMIVELASESRFLPTAESMRRLESSMTEAHVKALLKLHPPTRHVPVGVSAEGKIVRLTGTVPTDELRSRCELVAWRVPGIQGVQNGLAVGVGS